MNKDSINSNEAFEKALEKQNEHTDQEQYILRLFVSGMNVRSIRAIQELEKICNQHLKGRYQLEIIDIYQHPEMAKSEQIVAVPALIKKIPAPLRRFIGDLSETEKLIVGLDLVSDAEKNADRGKTD